jgi:DNA-binding LytR/AlgR family response regulator
MQPTLNDLEARLDPEKFCRISRSAIVTLEAVRQITLLEGGYGSAMLSDGTKLNVSRRRLSELTSRLGGRDFTLRP